MRRHLILLFIILAATGLMPADIGFLKAGAASLDDYVEGEVIVQPNPGVTIAQINQVYGTHTLALLSLNTPVYRLAAPAGMTTADLLLRMALDIGNPPARMAFAEPNYVGRAPEAGSNDHWNWGGNDPAPYNTQYAYENLNLALVHTYTQGAGTVVAVLDTGVATTHPALAGHLVSPMRWRDFVDDDNDPSEVLGGLASGHGTHVAGLVSLAAPQTRLLPVRVLDADGAGNAWRVADAIRWAADDMALHGERGVINLSLGTTVEADILREAVRYAVDERNVIVVAAVGNQNLPSLIWPAADSRPLAVTALDPFDRKAAFANYGLDTDVAAYGVSIYSTMIYTDGTPGYAWWSGTSMAAPLVSGVAALYRANNPADTAHDAIRNIRDAAYGLDYLNPSYAGMLGHGLLDPLAAIMRRDGCFYADVLPALPAQCDRQVTVSDVQAVADGWGRQRQDPGFNRRLDLDRDDRVDIVDVQMAAAAFGPVP